MPEPDLPPLIISDKEIADIKAGIPELPEAKRDRFIEKYGLSQEQSDLIADDLPLANYFEAAASELTTTEKILKPEVSQLLVNYILSDLKGLMQKSQSDTIGSAIRYLR